MDHLYAILALLRKTNYSTELVGDLRNPIRGHAYEEYKQCRKTDGNDLRCSRKSRLLAVMLRCAFLWTVFGILTASSFAGVVSIPVPTITFLSPVSTNPGGPDFTLTVNGANFVDGISVVNWGATPLATIFVSPTQLTATVPAAQTANGGTGWITVSNTRCSGDCNVVSNVSYFPVTNATSTYIAVKLTAAVGATPFQLTDGDFNKDGKLDLAVSNFSDSTLSILLGNGDGTFQPQQTFSTLNSPFGIATGDLNGDGITDLVVGNDSTGLNIFLGDANGDGGFTAGISLGGGNCPLLPVLADFNHDGNLDIVVGNECGQGIEVYLGNGDGTFGPLIPVTGSDEVFGMVVADFNGDGILDLAAADYGNSSVDIYLGLGDGTFGTVTQIPVASEIITLITGDFNVDGKVDLVGGSELNTGITIFYGNGDGTFPTQSSVVATGSYRALAAEDLNGDGALDIIGINSGGAVQVWFSAAEGSFQSPQTIGSSGGDYGVTLGNFATSGGLDIATGNNSADQVAIFVPTVVISPSSEDFGLVSVGSSSQQSFSVTNDTSSTVTISGISFTGTNPGDFSEINTCSSPLATAGICTVTVTFTPAAIGVRAAVLTVTDNAPGSPQTATLTGTGFAAPIVSLSTLSLTFGSQNIGVTSASQPVVLSNTGNAALNIASISTVGTNSGDFQQTNNCPVMLNLGSQCTVNVTFTPSLVGAENASLQFSDDASNSPQLVALGGTGTNVPPNYSIAANPTSLTIIRGQSGNTVLTITPVGGMTGTLGFSCTGLPAKTNCVFSPTQVVMTGNDAAATVTLTINTTGPNGVISQLRSSPFSRISSGALAVLICPVGFVLLMIPGWVKAGKKHTRYAYLAFLLLLGLFVAVGMTACGGVSSSAGTQLGQYSVSAVASVGGSNSQSAVVTISITN
jgi:hypothetical protein